jgi:hypothetical protein
VNRILLLALGVSVLPPEWEPEKAGRKLDERAAIWESHPRSAVEFGLSWLVTHQDDLGGWAAESVNKDRSGEEPFTAGFMSDAATAFAVLALSPR